MYSMQGVHSMHATDEKARATAWGERRYSHDRSGQKGVSDKGRQSVLLHMAAVDEEYITKEGESIKSLKTVHFKKAQI